MKQTNLNTMFLFVVLVIFSTDVFGQTKDKYYPNGFNLGFVVEGNLSQQPHVFHASGALPAPIFKGGFGWKCGLEFSYGFCDNYAISVGLDYGTVAQFRRKIFLPMSQFYSEGKDKFEDYGQFSYARFQMPVKFEIHTPLKNTNWTFNAFAGVNILNITESIGFAITHINMYGMNTGQTVSILEEETQEIKNIYNDYMATADNNKNQISLDMICGVGVSYRLPYNDLIRVNFVVNYSFRDKMRGQYYYANQNSNGHIGYRHNYLGLQVAYIHCFGQNTK